MARAQDVQQGQVWSDSQGRRFEITGPQTQNGFPVRNIDTQRQAWKGPRALVNLLNPPAGSVPSQEEFYRAQMAAQYGHQPEIAHGAMTDPTWGYGGPPPPPSFEEHAPDYDPEPAPRPRRTSPARRGFADPHPASLRGMAQAQRPEMPVAIAPPAPSIPMPPQLPAGYPSELTAFIAESLRNVPPARAHSPSMVSRAVAQALAAWKARHPGSY